jgi:hypothetical protein
MSLESLWQRYYLQNNLVEVLGDFEFFEYTEYNRRLGGPSMVTKEVTEGDEVISLFEIGI